MSRVRNYIAGGMLSYASFGFSALAGLFYTPWMLEIIGQSQYGLYTLAMSLVQLFMTDVGLKMAVMGFLSRYYAKNETVKVQTFLGIAYKLYFIISAIVTIVVALIYFNIEAIFVGLTPQEIDEFRYIYLIVAAYSIFTLPCSPFDAILNIKEQFIGLNVCDLFQKILTVIFIIIALLLGGGVLSLVLANVTLGILNNLVKYLIIRCKTDAKANLQSWDSALAKELLGYSGWQAVIQTSENLFSGIVPSLLAIFSTSLAVSYYGLASMIGSVIYSLGVVLRRLSMAKVGRILASSNRDELLQGFMEQIGRLQLCVVGLVFLGFALCGIDFISLWSGWSSVPILYPCILLLMFPNVIRMVQDIGYAGLTVSGNIKPVAVVNLIMVTISVGLLLVLASKYGALAAGIAVFFGGVFRAVALQVIFRKTLHIKTSHFVKQTYGRWILPTVGVVFVVFFVKELLPFTEWPHLILTACLISILYLTSMYFLVLTSNDRSLLKSNLKKH